MTRPRPTTRPDRSPRVTTPDGERGLRVVRASRRRKMMRRARIGLIFTALCLFGIVFVGVAQLRLTTQTAAVERQMVEVKATNAELLSRLNQQKNDVYSRAPAELGMVNGPASEKASLPLP